MNRKFSINSIALGTIHRRRGRYLLLIVGIVLAIYFVATALLFADTMFTSLREQHYNRLGEQDAIVFNCGEEPLTELIITGIFSEYGTAEILGYVLPDNENMANGFSIARFDENALKLTRKEPLEGRLPEKVGEIALERSTLARLRSDAGVGDRITLTLLIPDGTGFMETPVNKSYTLVGILSDKLFHLERSFNILPAYGDCPAGVLFAGEQIEPGGRAVVNCYGRYAGDAAASFEKLKGFFLQTEAEENAWWSKLQQTHYQPFGSSYNGNQDEIILTSLFFTIIGSVLVCAACLGIINTFSTDLASRRRQIGLFRAVGATQQQIRAIYGREATLLALCAVPLGLALAALTVRGITGLLGESFTFRLNALILALVAVAGITCVRLAAALPLRKAARIAPMQAIRDVELTRKLKRNRARSKTNFDVPRHLAHRSQALYRSRQAGITAMLALSIVLLSLVTFAAAPLAEDFEHAYGIDYLMQNPSRSTNWLMEENFHRPGITEQDRSDAAALPAVKSVTGEKLLQVKILTDKVTPYVTGNGCGGFGYLTPEPAPDLDSDPESGRWLKQQHRDYLASKEKYGYARDYLTVDCCAADAAILEQLTPFVAEGRIDLDKLSAGEEILIAAPSEYGFYRGEQPGGGGSALQVDYGLSSSAEYEQILQNDIFFAGEPLDLSLLYSDLPAGHDRAEQRHGDGSRKLPENAVRLDKTVTIGAVLELRAGDLSLDSFFHSYYSEFCAVITTVEGLHALGFEVPYSNLAVTLYQDPDAALGEYLEMNLSGIAARTPGMELTSYVAEARENKKTASGLLIAAGAVLLLFFTICASMINNALSARIRAGKREIGTLRAVGASGKVITRSYRWQLLSTFAWGTAAGMALQLGICGWLLWKGADSGYAFSVPLWQPLLFVTLLFGICLLNVNSKVGAVFKDSIVENIREL